MNIIKSKYDRLNYKYLILPNDLRVILINDPLTTTSYVNMMVKVGSFNDTISGIAHFLEHMLFMGSKAYPDENYFSALISQYNGTYNAYTDSNNTDYHFSVHTENLYNILDVFSHFFIDPLFVESAVNREINAVNAEYQKNIGFNNSKFFDVLKLIANRNHPFSHFSTGCTETLKIKNIRDELIKFYNKYYSANIMCLIIYDRRSFKDLEKMIHIFENVPNRDIVLGKIKEKLFLKTPVYAQMVPLNDEHTLTIMWQINEWMKYYKYKPLNYISYLFNRASKGGLLDVLLNAGYATTIGLDALSDTNTLVMEIRMTDHGVKHETEILNYVYAYIKLIKKYSINKKIYDMLKNASTIDFNFSDNVTPHNHCIYISTNILFHKNPTLAVCLKNLYHKYDETAEKLIQKFLNCMTIENSVVISNSSSHKMNITHISKWHSAEYNIFDIFPFTIDYSCDMQEISFIPKILDTKISNTNVIREKTIMNKTLLKTKIKTWFTFNCSFNKPLVYVCFIIDTKNNDLHDQTTSLMFELLFRTIFRDELEYLSLIQTDFIFIQTINKYIIKFVGLNTTILDIIKLFIRFITDKKMIDTSDIDFAMSKATQILSRYTTIPPYLYSRELIRKHISSKYFLEKDLYESLKDFKQEHLFQLKDKIITGCDPKLIIVGNIMYDDVIELSKQFNLFHNKKKLFRPDEYITNDSDDIIIQKPILSSDTNHVVEILLKYGYIKNSPNKYIESCMYQIVSMILKEPFFDEMRTKHQLGYITKVSNELFGYADNPYYVTSFIIQSPSTAVDKIEELIFKFLDKFDINKVNINAYIKSYKQTIEQKSDSIEDIFVEQLEGVLSWNSFEYIKKLSDACESITKEMFMKFYEKYVKKSRKIWMCKLEN